MTKGNKNKCFYCGQPERCTKDHFYPKSKGGRLCVYACQVCQGSKRDMHPMAWLQYVLSHQAFNDDTKQRIKTAVTTLNNQEF